MTQYHSLLTAQEAKKCGITRTVFLGTRKKETVWILPFKATTRLKIHLCMNTNRKIYTHGVLLKTGFK